MEKIIAVVSPVEKEQKIYIYSDLVEIVPLVLTVKTEELYSAISMSAAKYNIKEIFLSGAKNYVLGIKQHLEEKIENCFGYNHNITIELLKKRRKK